MLLTRTICFVLQKRGGQSPHVGQSKPSSSSSVVYTLLYFHSASGFCPNATQLSLLKWLLDLSASRWKACKTIWGEKRSELRSAFGAGSTQEPRAGQCMDHKCTAPASAAGRSRIRVDPSQTWPVLGNAAK